MAEPFARPRVELRRYPIAVVLRQVRLGAGGDRRASTSCRGFDDGFVGSWQLGEVPLDAERRIRDALLIDDGAAVVIRCDEGIALVLVNAGIEHGVPSWSDGLDCI